VRASADQRRTALQAALRQRTLKGQVNARGLLAQLVDLLRQPQLAARPAAFEQLEHGPAARACREVRVRPQAVHHGADEGIAGHARQHQFPVLAVRILAVGEHGAGLGARHFLRRADAGSEGSQRFRRSAPSVSHAGAPPRAPRRIDLAPPGTRPCAPSAPPRRAQKPAESPRRARPKQPIAGLTCASERAAADSTVPPSVVGKSFNRLTRRLCEGVVSARLERGATR